MHDVINIALGGDGVKIEKSADAARAIKTRRLSQGLTQHDVAQSVGITRQSLARIEKGKGGGAFDTYLRLFDLLEIQLEAHFPEEAGRATQTAVSLAAPPRERPEVSIEQLRAAIEASEAQFDLVRQNDDGPELSR